MDPYRILVTGSRTWLRAAVIREALEEELIKAVPRPVVVVHGGALGADSIADDWGWNTDGVTVEEYLARWRKNGVYNPQAGLLRNRQMVDAGADVCLAFIHNGSRGATHCADLAESAGIPTRRFLL